MNVMAKAHKITRATVDASPVKLCYRSLFNAALVDCHKMNKTEQAKAFIASNPSLKARLMTLMSLLALVLMVMVPSVPAYADKPPTALESACFKNPKLLVCQWVANSLEKEQNNQQSLK